MSIAFSLTIGRHWCQIAVHPLSWLLLAQSIKSGPSNFAFGPLRLTLN